MGQLLDLVRSLQLDKPDQWLPGGSQFVGPMPPQPEPPPLTGWRKAADESINAVVGTFKGVTGLGDQGPAGPTWANAGALLAAVPFGVPEAVVEQVATRFPRFANAIKAYHGSPHDFEQFSLEKIGTGEGAQAYGHGLYFAEKEGTAKSYRDQLSGPTYHPEWAQAYSRVEDLKGELAHIEDAINRESLAAGAKGRPGWGTLGAEHPEIRQKWAPEIERVQRDLHAAQQHMQSLPETIDRPGRMYEVNIHADPAHFLDWDAPLKDQPANVKAAANDLFRGRLDTRDVGGGMVDVFEKGPGGRPGGSLGVYPKDKAAEVLANPADYYPYTGKNFYQQLESERAVDRGAWKNPSEYASQELKQIHGIPGIKYLDQGSRGGRAAYRGDSAYLHAAESFKTAGHSADDALAGLKEAYKSAKPSELQAAIHEAYDITPQTRNFVVFDDALIDILKKYGLSAAAIGLLHRALNERSEHDQ